MTSKIVAILAIGALVTGCAGGGPQTERIHHGTVAPPFVLSDLVTGDEFNSLKTIQSHHATVIALWSMSCPDCREALIDVQHLYEEYSPKSIAFASINFDLENLQGVRAFVKGEGLTFPTLWDKRRRVATDFKALDYTFSLFVIDRRGIVVLSQYDHPPDLRDLVADTVDYVLKRDIK
jgi:peroxiredoxin